MKNTKPRESYEEGITQKLDSIVNALDRIAICLESRRDYYEIDDEDNNIPEGLDFNIQERVSEVPSEIKFAKAEELAAKMVDFAKREFPDEDRININRVSHLFWSNIKVTNKWNMPAEIQLKIEKAELLAKKQYDYEVELKTKEQLEKEKIELPSLVSSCVDWAKYNGLKRVTQADVGAFLFNKNIEILPETKKSLYQLANVRIKSKS